MDKGRFRPLVPKGVSDMSIIRKARAAFGAGLRPSKSGRHALTAFLVLALLLCSLYPLASWSGNAGMSAGVSADRSDSDDDGPDLTADDGSDGADGSQGEADEENGGLLITGGGRSSSTGVFALDNDGRTIDLDARSSELSATNTGGTYVVRTDNYMITVVQSGSSVSYIIRPYFTTDYILYQRLDPLNADEGTVDEYGKDLNWVTTRITDWGQDGDSVWFLESCSQFSLRHTFDLYRDYFELEVAYAPGTSKVIVTYAIALCSTNGHMYDLFSDGQVHRYVPGIPEETPKTNGIGGWYPCYEMFAPAFDVRVPGRSLGMEWGFNEAEAYLYSPIWIEGDPVDGASVFGVKYTSTGGVLPDPSLGTEKTWHMFVRPYEQTDGEARGHDAGYAEWIGPQIAETWGYRSTEQFPLTFNDFGKDLNGLSGQWDASTRSWVEGSPILVATLSTNSDQVNWHYKSAQRYGSGTMPAEYKLHDSVGHAYTLSDGTAIASACSSAYRKYLISGDEHNEWWWSSTGVFWDEMNIWYGDTNEPRSDYNHRSGVFLHEGYLKLVQETWASGHFEFVITNSYTPSVHLAMLSDLTLVEGFEPSSIYGTDLVAHVSSLMAFVNHMSSTYRPDILVYQNYDTGSSSDQEDVYSVLFNAARNGFCVDLLSYDSYSSQMHNLRMAVAMFEAMGAERHQDPVNWPATIDLGSEGRALTTDRQMAVITGSGSVTVTFTEEHGAYTFTNLGSKAVTISAVLPGGSTWHSDGEGMTLTSLEKLSDGRVVFHGTLAAESTSSIIP